MVKVIIDFSYNKKTIDFIQGHILKGTFYKCSYIRYKTLYRNPAPGTENVELYNFTPRGGTRASVLILHGLGSRNIKFMLWLGTHLASVGVNSTIIILPGNYTRVEDKSVSGRSYIWPDIKLMYQFWEHAVVDVRTTIDLLQQQKIWNENNCVVGYCLGGMISSILASIDKRIEQTIFMTTGGYIPKILHESHVTAFARRLFEKGLNSEYYLQDKARLYNIYKEQFPIVKEMNLSEIIGNKFIHPLFRIDPISYAHLLDKSKVTFIDALFDETLPLKSRTMLFKEMKGANRYIVPTTHVGWLPFESFLAQYILLKVNINDKKSAALVKKKQEIFDYINLKFLGKL
ncbi:alpha/beta hydrolase [Clostridium sp. CX1]|uniref:alpha/beta hydrolase n=1 Tax=Clostridium TaxID=1485 RepID=UPI0021C1C6DC|nr:MULTISPECIES: alpha/beta hydrolase [unclassified Clostridium]MCT8977766.1 alpha/beta hydrolase [Clostridium sp. CX1]